MTRSEATVGGHAAPTPTGAASLGAQATPRPWRDVGYSDFGHDDTFGCNISDGQGGMITWAGVEGGEGAIPSHADAAFIVYAVNHIEATEARLAEAERLLSAVRNADVIFAKSDWHISRAIDAFLADDSLASAPAAAEGES